jgi:hypothetical protein
MKSGQNGTSVNLIPITNGTTFKEWNMSMNGGKSEGPSSYPVVSVDQTTGPTITYTIKTPGSITFDTTNPISIQAGTTKPTGGLDSQFSFALGPDKQGNANTVLTLSDTNQTAGKYTYVMNFVGAPQLDPIVDNSGPHVQNYLLWYGLGAIALIALIVLVARPMFRKQQPRDRM